jgi:hypothetical protein
MAAISVNTSATGGPLAPSSPPPADDLELDVILQVVIAGLTGLPRDLVLPRWQPTQPRIPDVGETWVAVGVTASTPDDMPAQIHRPDGDGYTILRSFYRLDVLASFYGPKSDAYAKLTRDGLYLSQNRDFLRSSGLNLIGFDTIRRAPDISGTQARRKSDLPFRLTQVIERQYPILNVRQASGTIQATGGNPQGSTQIDTPFASPFPPA